MAMVAIAQNVPPAGGQAGMGRMGAAPGGAAGAAAGRGGGVRSPEIAPDNKVTFRISAPQATSVTVNGDWVRAAAAPAARGAADPGAAPAAGGRGGTPMTKDANGLWSATVGPLESEMYGYTYNIDGASVWDPANMQLKRDGTRITSVVIVPGGTGDLYSIKDVPHGTLAQVWYKSASLNLKQRRMYVYTPPGYETSGQKYPVFYLLHGGGGDEDAWTSLGRTPQILDNMIASGKVKPMIVVMTNGNANQIASQDIVPAPPAARGGGAMGAGPGGVPGAARGEAGAGRGAAPGAAAPAGAPGAAAPAAGGAARGGGIGGSAFPESIVKDVIPFIEKNYRVKADQKNRAIAGLSMGGGHTRTVTLAHPGTFAYYGLMSGGTYSPNDLATHKKNLKLVFLSCGERENPDRVKDAANALSQAGFKAVSYVSPGSAHEWLTWRRSLIELAPLLFKD